MTLDLGQTGRQMRALKIASLSALFSQLIRSTLEQSLEGQNGWSLDVINGNNQNDVKLINLDSEIRFDHHNKLQLLSRRA